MSSLASKLAFFDRKGKYCDTNMKSFDEPCNPTEVEFNFASKTRGNNVKLPKTSIDVFFLFVLCIFFLFFRYTRNNNNAFADEEISFKRTVEQYAAAAKIRVE